MSRARKFTDPAHLWVRRLLTPHTSSSLRVRPQTAQIYCISTVGRSSQYSKELVYSVVLLMSSWVQQKVSMLYLTANCPGTFFFFYILNIRFNISNRKVVQWIHRLVVVFKCLHCLFVREGMSLLVVPPVVMSHILQTIPPSCYGNVMGRGISSMLRHRVLWVDVVINVTPSEMDPSPGGWRLF